VCLSSRQGPHEMTRWAAFGPRAVCLTPVMSSHVDVRRLNSDSVVVLQANSSCVAGGLVQTALALLVNVSGDLDLEPQCQRGAVYMNCETEGPLL